MQAKQSFQCHPVKSDPDSKSKNNIKPDLIDLSKTYEERRDERKSGKVIRRTDEVFFVDLPGTANYDKFLAKYIDPEIKLNVKGPFANLWWAFTRINETRESIEWRVSIHKLITLLQYFYTPFYYRCYY